jgi:hypothetical protein
MQIASNMIFSLSLIVKNEKSTDVPVRRRHRIGGAVEACEAQD